MENYLLSFTIFSTFLIVSAFIRSNNIVTLVILNGAFSLFAVIMYLTLDAPDVAMTEASVGALSAIFSIYAIKAIYKNNFLFADSFNPWLFGLALILALLLIYASLDLPSFGSPTFNHHYLENTSNEIDIPSVVASILASYRGYDTLLETLVILVGGFSVLLLSDYDNYNLNSENLLTPSLILNQTDGLKSEDAQSIPIREHIQVSQNSLVSLKMGSGITRKITRFILPLILLFALYIQFHGEISPGGGFQAGAIVAIAFILYDMVFESDSLIQIISLNKLKAIAISGISIYFATGLISLLNEASFLNYNVLGSNSLLGQKIGITTVELGVGLSISSTMLIIYFGLAYASDKSKL